MRKLFPVAQPIFLEDENGNPYPNYPDGFKRDVSKGDNYKVSKNTVTPDGNFVGTLSVPVRVSYGEDESDKFDLKILVFERQNVPPVIIGQLPLKVQQDKSLTISLKNLIVTDPDNKYPDDFTLNILSGDNYVVSENQVIPRPEFTGTLSVNVTVSDGTSLSNTFSAYGYCCKYRRP